MQVPMQVPLQRSIQRLIAKLPDAYSLVLISIAITLLAAKPTPNEALGILAIVLASLITDVVFTQAYFGKARISKSSLISSLIIAGISDPSSPLSWALVVALIALKHTCYRFKGPFPLANPAGGALLLLFILKPELEFWWANTNLALIGLLGTLVALKIRRLYISLSFLVGWTAIALAIIHPFPLGLHHFPFFLAFYMLTEPKTTPTKPIEQLVFGVAVAALEHAFSIAGLPSGALLALFVATFAYRGIPSLRNFLLRRQAR